ncbi:MAG: single-stranded DNA-binding protein [Deltaproteobacteria bacterium]|nr:single-stranded DNA-binding protein [Deltaproteobacteria bacterium]
MAGVNKVILLGNLGADPEARSTQSGSTVTNFRIATSEKWTGKDGQAQERTEWHRIVTFGRLADHCRDYLSKGRQVYVEGRIQTNAWEDREGNKRYTTEIIAQTVQFLGKGGGGGGDQGGGGGGFNQGGGQGGGGYNQGGGGQGGGGQGGGGQGGGGQGGGGQGGGGQGGGGQGGGQDSGGQGGGGWDPPPPISDDDVPF